jgi:hypothetical protein
MTVRSAGVAVAQTRSPVAAARVKKPRKAGPVALRSFDDAALRCLHSGTWDEMLALKPTVC